MKSVNFDRAAEYYDATRALPGEAMAELVGILGQELSGRQPCLEIGVGTGRIALPLHDQGITMAGVDIAEAMLRRLVVNAAGVPPFPLLLADATRLPAADGAFGSVLAVHVLHLIPAWREAVDEAVRVLWPGGVLIASFPTIGAHPRHPADPAASPPWAGVLREAAERQGVIRDRIGASDPAAVVAHLGGRATARQLPAVTVTEVWTLSRTLRDLEEQLFSWTWPYSREQVLAAGAEVRAWAAREGVSLADEHAVEGTLQWWAFDLTG